MDLREQHLQQFIGKPVHVVIDRPIGYQHGDMVYPVNYGYIPGVIAGDGEEQDVYILGVDQPLSQFDGFIIGAIRRKNDAEDKLIAAPEGMRFHQAQIKEAVHFQEQYFDHYIISLFHKSCGILPYRVTENGREYLIVFEQHSQCWSLPKGHMEPGETEIQTALREIKEETGLTARITTKASVTVEYPISPVSKKQVVFFLGEVSGIPRVLDGEIEAFRWIKADSLSNYLHPDTATACNTLIVQQTSITLMNR